MCPGGGSIHPGWKSAFGVHLVTCLANGKMRTVFKICESCFFAFTRGCLSLRGEFCERVPQSCTFFFTCQWETPDPAEACSRNTAHSVVRARTHAERVQSKPVCSCDWAHCTTGRWYVSNGGGTRGSPSESLSPRSCRPLLGECGCATGTECVHDPGHDACRVPEDRVSVRVGVAAPEQPQRPRNGRSHRPPPRGGWFPVGSRPPSQTTHTHPYPHPSLCVLVCGQPGSMAQWVRRALCAR